MMNDIMTDHFIEIWRIYHVPTGNATVDNQFKQSVLMEQDVDCNNVDAYKADIYIYIYIYIYMYMG